MYIHTYIHNVLVKSYNLYIISESKDQSRVVITMISYE